MSILFYISAVAAIIAALLVVTRANAMHALIYLIVLFLAIASIFFTLGAPFVAALQIIIYAGAIMVLFVFVVMMLNLGRTAQQQERSWLSGLIWIVPTVLAVVLLVFFVMTLAGKDTAAAGAVVNPKTVGKSLFTTYIIGVELASMLLLAALAAGYHFGVLPSRLGRDYE